MAKTLPPVWLPHAHNGFFGTFEGGQRIHVKLEARVSIVYIFTHSSTTVYFTLFTAIQLKELRDFELHNAL